MRNYQAFHFPLLVFLNLLLVLVVFLGLGPYFLSSEGVEIVLPRVISAFPGRGSTEVVVIRKDGQVYLGDSNKSVSANELGKSLGNLKKAGKVCGVLIKADRRAPIESLAQVWDIARDKGIEQVSIATSQ